MEIRQRGIDSAASLQWSMHTIRIQKKNNFCWECVACSYFLNLFSIVSDGLGSQVRVGCGTNEYCVVTVSSRDSWIFQVHVLLRGNFLRWGHSMGRAVISPMHILRQSVKLKLEAIQWAWARLLLSLRARWVPFMKQAILLSFCWLMRETVNQSIYKNCSSCRWSIEFIDSFD